MKRKELILRSFLPMVLAISLVTASIPVGATQESKAEATQEGEAEAIQESKAEATQESEAEATQESKAEATQESEAEVSEEISNVEENVIEVSTPAELMAVAEKCRYDSWSEDKTIRLTADIDMQDMDFSGIPYFNGVFDGNGFEIRQLRFEPKGTDYGFFRYIGASGVVKNLTVSGVIMPSGTQENIGGLVGVNYGMVLDCSFEGSVSGLNYVGAIAGRNTITGSIISCSSNARVLATNYTGGIVGYNEGIVSGCTSKSSVNTEELETTLDLGGVDIGTMNFTQTMVNRNDMGGIAGFSGGIISDCKNLGTIGYKHTGYNAGGIVGGQDGIVISCTNEGSVYGRKDVGGIVGQAEPYIESDYLEDEIEQAKTDVNRLNNILSNLSTTLSQTSAEVKKQAEGLNKQYTDSVKNAVDNYGSISSNLQNIQGSDAFTEEDLRNHLSGQMNGDNSKGESVEELLDRISEQVKEDERTAEIQELANTLDNGVQSISKGIESAVDQLNHIAGNISSDIQMATSDEEYIEDISSLETAEKMDGVISGCVNRGTVDGDLNVGGIAGVMNVEYDGDPEYDIDTSESLNVRLRSTVNDVILHCINYGSVTAKMNYAGGITGFQEIGFIYDCEGYGKVESSAGSYLGGISGRSAGAIEKSYSLCNLSGEDYIGGICGSGTSVKECISISNIESDGERLGSIAGYLETDGNVKGNLFVSDKLHGVDGISYVGAAEPISYEKVMELEAIPRGFQSLTIVFETEEEVLLEKQIAYGGSIVAADFPVVPEKEGCYVKWPAESELTDIQSNLTITAEYVPWTESVAGQVVDENGDKKNLFLLEGEFYEGTTVSMEQIDGPKTLGEDAAVAYAYSWTLESDAEKEYKTLGAHFLIPSTETKSSVWILQDGEWNQVTAIEDGSYLVAELPYGASFAVVTQPAEQNTYLFVIGGGVILLLVIFLIWRHTVRKSKGK